jgi:CheY-like chemotaxis protein
VSTANATSPKLRSVLLVEDNPDNRLALRTLLELWGYQVDEASDGCRAIEIALEREPEIALVDIGLPGASGYEVAERVRSASGRKTFLVALTGYGRSDDRQRALDSGFDAHLVKPIDPDELERLLARTRA